MRIIEPSVEIYTEYDHFRKIETIARVCTGTQDKVGSKPGFVENLWKNRHETPFEHVRIEVEKLPASFCYLPHEEQVMKLIFGEEMSGDTYGQSYRRIKEREKVLTQKTGREVFREFTAVNGRDYLAMGGKLDSLNELPESDDYMTVKFTVDIGVARELIRHRQFSFQERSTRYCNMSDGIEFIKPVPFEWVEFNHESDKAGNYTGWIDACFNAEKVYMRMIKRGARPQEARTVLPLSTATVLYVTGMYKQWEDMLKLRLAPGAHPQMRYIMQKLVELGEFPKNKIKVPEFEHSEKKN